jgi:hypothetical protein
LFVTTYAVLVPLSSEELRHYLSGIIRVPDEGPFLDD